MRYSNNVGLEEMVKFYQIASEPQIAQMEKIAGESNWPAYKLLILSVLGITLN